MNLQDLLNGSLLSFREAGWGRPVGLSFVATLLVLAGGCGGSDHLAEVQGTVRLDGAPLPNAFLTFVPIENPGGPAYGRTDSEGRYAMEYSREQSGAVLGRNRVRITTKDVVMNSDGGEGWSPERVPPVYNEKSELVVTVDAGANVIDFDLDPDAEPGGVEMLR